MTRVMFKTFFGENRLHLAHDDHGHDAHGVDAHGVDAHAVDAHAVDPHAVDTHAVDAHGSGHGDHDGPHESNWWILTPLVLLAIPAFVVGVVQWPFGWGGIPKNGFEHFIANITFEDSVEKAHMVIPFKPGVAIPSIALAVAGIAASLVYYVVLNGDLGFVRRFAPARWFHRFLKNKYYLDHLWSGVVVGSIKGPIAKAAYWVNQNVLDGVVNTVGTGAAATGRLVYKFVDQGLVDGLVNGSGTAARDGGGILRILQSGRVQNYAALFLGGVGIIGLALALFV
jgi:NADH-quinone oxidoreductase subunit L